MSRQPIFWIWYKMMFYFSCCPFLTSELNVIHQIFDNLCPCNCWCIKTTFCQCMASIQSSNVLELFIHMFVTVISYKGSLIRSKKHLINVLGCSFSPTSSNYFFNSRNISIYVFASPVGTSTRISSFTFAVFAMSPDTTFPSYQSFMAYQAEYPSDVS